MKRTKADELTEFRAPWPKLTGRHLDVWNVLTGNRKAEAVYNAVGVLLADNAALIRLRGEPEFVLAVEISGEVYRTGLGMSGFAREVEKLGDKVKVFPRDPVEVEAERRRREFQAMTEGKKTHALVEMYERQGIKARVVGSPGEGLASPDTVAPRVAII